MGFAQQSAGLGIAGIIWIARAHAFPLPYEGIILATVFFYFLTGLRFAVASLCGWLTFLAYLAVELISGLDSAVLLYNLFFLATANVIGSVGCYFLEYATRHNFLALGLLQDLAERIRLPACSTAAPLANAPRPAGAMPSASASRSPWR